MLQQSQTEEQTTTDKQQTVYSFAILYLNHFGSRIEIEYNVIVYNNPSWHRKIAYMHSTKCSSISKSKLSQEVSLSCDKCLQWMIVVLVLQ